MKKPLSKQLTMQTMSIYWQHSKKYLLFFSLSIFAIIGYTVANLYEPFWYKVFFDRLGSGHATAHSLISVLVIIFIINFFGWTFHRIETINTSKYQANVMSDLLNTCFEYLQLHSYNYFNSNFAGSLVRKITRYSKSFEDISDQITLNMGQILVQVGGIIIVLLVTHFLLGLGLLIWAILFITVNYWFAVYRLPYDLERSEMDTKVTAQLSDTVVNNINLKLFGGTRAENISFRKLTAELNYLRQRSWRLGLRAEAIQGALMIVLEFVIMFLAVKLWEQGKITIGDFVLVQAYLIQVFQQLWNFGRYFRRLYESLSDANEMTEILLTPHEVQDKPGAKVLQVPKGKIEFKQVGFGYHDEKSVFENFNLEINSGERVAFVGPSGGGKSTITKILFRFFDIQNGKILIDGQNIAHVTQESLRANVGLVPQEPILFHRTLRENISYGKPTASKEEIMRAAKLAHCHEFILQFPEGYETYVGERGVKLSGGERQRVAIARAILKNAPILVLDEATSSLDSESEKLIQDALHTLMQNKTTIVIAHRLSTIMQMDRIVVIENGKITEQGKHAELVKAEQGTYQKLWEIQAGGFA